MTRICAATLPAKDFKRLPVEKGAGAAFLLRALLLLARKKP